MTIPKIGSIVKIESRKHDGKAYRCWEENVVLFADDNTIIGYNHHTKVTEDNGATWYTTIPALFYFTQSHWFNVIYMMDQKVPYYYCNICSPYTFQHGTIQYVDYDIDFIVQLDYTYKIVDQDEYEANIQKYCYPEMTQASVQHAIKQLQSWIKHEKGPFQPERISYWQSKIKNTFL